MKHKVEFKDNDGMFLQGGHPLTITLEYEERFIDRVISNYYHPEDGVDYLIGEVAKDISGHIMIDITDNPPEKDTFIRSEEGPYTYTECDWKLTIDAFFGIHYPCLLYTSDAADE